MLFWVCCFHSDNFYGPWFVFITEREFDNTDMKGTASIELRHVSGFLTHRSVKWYLNPLNNQFCCCGSAISAGITAIVSSYVTLIKNRFIRKVIKRYKENVSHVSFLKRSVAVKIIQFLPADIQFFQFHLSKCNKSTTFLVKWNTF